MIGGERCALMSSCINELQIEAFTLETGFECNSTLYVITLFMRMPIARVVRITHV